MKAILKFLLNTGTGKLLLQAIVSFIVDKFRKGLKKAEERGIPLDSALDIIHEEIHADVTGGQVKNML